MPLAVKWSSFNKENVSKEKDNYGIYELGNSEDILYIGQGIAKLRLMSHFPDGTDPIVGVSLYRVEYIGSKERAEQRERVELANYERRHGRLPKFNHRRG